MSEGLATSGATASTSGDVNNSNVDPNQSPTSGGPEPDSHVKKILKEKSTIILGAETDPMKLLRGIPDIKPKD